MANKKMLMPAEIAEYTIEAGVKKATTPNKKVLASAFLAGAYIAFGALGSVGAAYNLLANPDTYGLGKMVAGLMFPAGLMFVLIAGADLFTGNILITLAALKKRVTWGQAFKEYGFLEGLFVYPLAWIVHAIVEALGDTGWIQILAIFVVTILVRLITIISTLVQNKSTTKQQKIQPLLNELAKKYPNSEVDKEQRNAMAMEQAQLMKKYKIHPFLPILFMIIQFPLFICIWSALQGSAALAAGNFYGLPLTTRVSECFTTKGLEGKWVGIVIFILMSVANALSSMTGLWFNTWKSKNFNNTGIQKKDENGNVVDPNKTMKIMNIVMMVFVIFMGWSLPVGMGIYWLIGALMSIVQTLLMEALAMRSRHNDMKNTGDGSSLAAIRRSSRHIGQDNKQKKQKKSADKPLWR